MKYFLYFAYCLLTPSLAIHIGCFENVTFSGISIGLWLNQTNDCDFCKCYMLMTNSSALNCYMNATNGIDCLIFSDYSSLNGDIQLIADQNGSSACFVKLPPIVSVESTTPITIPSKTVTDEVSTTPPICAGHIQSTILLQLYNAPSQPYTRYSFVYRATASKARLMFCFLNQQHFWALDDVSMEDTITNRKVINDGNFESASWTYWTYYNSAYYGSGMSSGYSSWQSHGGSYFYLDVQYTDADGIFQDVTTVVGRNYTISFYLANPSGGNFSVAIVSVGS